MSNTFEQNKLVFSTAFNKVKNPDTWTQHGIAHDKKRNIVKPDDATACKWCSIGAMEYAYALHGIPDDAELFDQFYKTVNRIVSPSRNNSISHYNDYHCHEEIVRLWELVGTEYNYL